MKLRYAFAGVFILMVSSYFYKKQLPETSALLPSLFQEPQQNNYPESSVEDQKKTVSYMGNNYEIEPKAHYVLTGLVVSTNNPTGFGDIYHDETSFDTKDLCVVWGSNLKDDKHSKVKFWNVSWTCNWRYSSGLDWDNNRVSNNHLVADNQSIRDQIAGVKPGDQIQLEGDLVNYLSLSTGFRRETSLVRTDNRDYKGCEVMLVEKVKIIKPVSRIPEALYKLSSLLLGALVIYGLFFRKLQFNKG